MQTWPNLGVGLINNLHSMDLKHKAITSNEKTIIFLLNIFLNANETEIFVQIKPPNENTRS
jgi:hypothetical protein